LATAGEENTWVVPFSASCFEMTQVSAWSGRLSLARRELQAVEWNGGLLEVAHHVHGQVHRGVRRSAPRRRASGGRRCQVFLQPAEEHPHDPAMAAGIARRPWTLADLLETAATR
jgi:hypothetical protein